LHECTAAEALNDSSLLFNRVVAEDISAWMAATKHAMRTMSVFDHELRIRRKSGEIRWHRMISKPRRAEDGAILFDGLDMDITERKHVEEALQASAAQLKGILDNLQDAYFQADMSGKFTMANPAALRMYGYDSFTELLGQPAQNLYADQNDRDALLAELRRSQHVTDMILRGRRKDGSTFWVSMNVQFVRNRDGRVIGTEGVVRDITDRKQAEEQIKQSLREKETLLQELYHRTKNNMQVIRSMLSLRAATYQNPAISEFVREVDQKILAMALVHQKLYQAQDLSWIRLDEYVAELADLTLRSYQTTSAADIALRLELDPVSVLLDTATPCGLIVNELVSNALKHAFPGGRAGEIRIRVCRAPDSAVELYFADNGVGLPDGFDLHTHPTLGLQIVTVLVNEQLKGELRLNGQPGIAYTIRFHDNLYTPRVTE
jgi:PAS domain S-box-containing protein